MNSYLYKMLGFVFLLFILGLDSVKAQTVDSGFVDGTVYVKIHDDSDIILEPYNYSIPGMNQVMNEYGITEMVNPFKTPDAALQKIYRIKFTKWEKIDNLIADLQKLGFLEYAEKAPLYRVNNIPNDYNPSAQWSLAKINAPQAWDFSTGSSAVTIAVIDNGVAYNHVDLVSNIHINTGEIPGNSLDEDLNGYPDDVNGYDVADRDNNPAPPTGTTNNSYFVHGTVCAGIASASTNNGVGIASIGYSVTIIPVKCASDNSDGSQLTNAYEGLDYAISSGADVVSMSFGSRSSFFTWGFLISAAQARNIILVASAGNDTTEEIFYPAGYSYVIAVGATDQADTKAAFSNYGKWIDVMAPGVNIKSTFPQDNSTYANATGTSMSCPLVAGLAGLILSLDGSLSAGETKAYIKNGCDNIDELNPGFSGKLGSGRINAYNSLNSIVAINAEEVSFNNVKMTIYPNPGKGIFYIRIGENLPAGSDLKIFNSQGQLLYSRAFNELGTEGTRLIAIDNLNPGHYSVQLRSREWVETQKVIIR